MGDTATVTATATMEAKEERDPRVVERATRDLAVTGKPSVNHLTSHPTLSTLQSVEREAREEKDTTTHRSQFTLILFTLLSVILLLTATETTAALLLLTHALVAREEKVLTAVTTAATTLTAALTSTDTAHGGCKYLLRSLSTTPWYSILVSKRMFV